MCISLRTSVFFSPTLLFGVCGKSCSNPWSFGIKTSIPMENSTVVKHAFAVSYRIETIQAELSFCVFFAHQKAKLLGFLLYRTSCMHLGVGMLVQPSAAGCGCEMSVAVWALISLAFGVSLRVRTNACNVCNACHVCNVCNVYTGCNVM